MKKSMCCIVLTALVGAGLLLTPTSVLAQEEKADSQLVTQGELAKLLVRVLDLSRNMQGDFSAIQASGILSRNKIAPDGGWKLDQVVTRDVLARLIVQALGIEDEVKNPDDPKSWIDLLNEKGIPIGTVGQAVDNLAPVAVPVSPGPGIATVDPLKAPALVAAEDELQEGADISDPNSTISFISMEEVKEVISVVPPRRRRVTPS